MELIYATLLLHAVKQKIDEENLSKVLSAAGVSIDAAKIKALVASLEGINIDEALKNATLVQAAAAPQTAVEKKEEKKAEEDTEKKAEEAASGLGALFG